VFISLAAGTLQLPDPSSLFHWELAERAALVAKIPQFIHWRDAAGHAAQ